MSAAVKTKAKTSEPPRKSIVVEMSIGECAAIGQRSLIEEIHCNFTSPFVSLWRKIRGELEGESGVVLKLAEGE